MAAFASWRLCVMGLVAAVLATGAPARAVVQSTPSVQTRLTGAWKIDRRRLPDNQDVWRRRVDALPAAAAPGVMPPLAAGLPDPMAAWPVNYKDALEVANLRTAMRDLLETAERLSFQPGADAVTITDDLNRVRTYATTGKKEKRQFAATEFGVQTRWNGQALAQQITAWTFAMTEVYLPNDDGQELLVSIKIEKPAFQPPIKDILRIYTRTGPTQNSELRTQNGGTRGEFQKRIAKLRVGRGFSPARPEPALKDRPTSVNSATCSKF